MEKKFDKNDMISFAKDCMINILSEWDNDMKSMTIKASDDLRIYYTISKFIKNK